MTAATNTPAPVRPHGDDWNDEAEVFEAIEIMKKRIDECDREEVEIPARLRELDAKLYVYRDLRDQLGGLGSDILEAAHGDAIRFKEDELDDDRLTGATDRASDLLIARIHEVIAQNALRVGRAGEIARTDLANLEAELERVRARDASDQTTKGNA